MRTKLDCLLKILHHLRYALVYLTSAWEIAIGKRHRFVWTQSSQEGLIVTLNLDHKELPTPSRQLILWPNSDMIL